MKRSRRDWRKLYRGPAKLTPLSLHRNVLLVQSQPGNVGMRNLTLQVKGKLGCPVVPIRQVSAKPE